jgi:hypothetical protein
MVLTDSGGVQEETTALRIPCLTLRDNTERPVTVSEGSNAIAGRDPSVILALCRDILRYGGKAGSIRNTGMVMPRNAWRRPRPTGCKRAGSAADERLNH